MQVLYSICLGMAMCGATRLTKADNQQCMRGPGPTCCWKELAYQDDHGLFGVGTEFERGLPVLNSVLARDGHRLRLDTCSVWIPAF